MENVEAIVVVSPLDIFDDGCKHKSSLKSSLSFKSMQRNDSSCIDSEIVEKKRVHFRETIEVFSDGEEKVSVPLNDDFTTFPSLRSPLRRLIGRRQRMHQRFIQASEDLYMVGDLYSNVPIIVLKKNIQPASVDLIAPLATMDDMDLFDGFDDDEQSTNDWIDDVDDDPNGYYYCGSDDLSAESDSDDVDEVMGMLLREKCLSDEDFGMSSSNDHYESDDGVSVDVVKKEVSVDDFFNEANIEEIESSSSTDSMADSDHFNGMTNFDECRDVTGNLMGIIPEECFHATHEPSNDISSPDFPRPLSESECYKNANDSYSLKNHSDIVNEINILNTSEVSRISHLVPSSIQDKVIIDEVKFEDASVGVVRSKSIDFKNSLDSGHIKVNSMIDSGFASLEMADLESKLVSSPNDDGSRRLIRGAPPSDNQMRIEEQDDSLEDKFSCSSDSNVSGSLSNFSPHSFETSDKKTSNGLHLSKSTDNFLSEKSRLTSSEDESNRETAILSAEENFPQNIHVSTLNKLTMNRSSCYRVELLPMLTWVFCHPQ